MIKSIVESLFGGPSSSHPSDLASHLRPSPSPSGDTVARPASGALDEAVRKAQTCLLRMQNREDGYWCPPLFIGTAPTSDTVMLLNFLGRGNSIKARKYANFLLDQQLPDGGWPIYRNGPADLSSTVKAYWALKFAGHSPNEPRLAAARKKIRELGGIHRVNTYTKFYLALFGQYDWRGVPTIPPELMLFPNWFYFNIYEMSSWTRSIVVPLSIIWAYQPSVPCPPHATLDELFPDSRRHVSLDEAVGPHALFSWKKFFLLWDRGLKTIEGNGGHWIRVWALRLAEDWMLRHLADSDGLGAIHPGVLNTIMAMKCLGYPDTDPRLVEQLETLDRLEHHHTSDSWEMMPCPAPVWDTAISVIALTESGIDRKDPALVRAVDWLISKEVRVKGDVHITAPEAPATGWHFQFKNPFAVDFDDTAMVMLALRSVHLDGPLSEAREKACRRGLDFLWAVQNPSGGWAAFDKDNTKEILTKIPFADHNAMIDPPTADITGRVLELMGKLGYERRHAGIQKAVRFLREEQEQDGSWYGRWCVNYIYGTWQVLRGLAAVGEDMNQPYVQKAAAWLKSVQLPDGGWGETCATYADPAMKGKGPATPSQTAWAIMGLMAAGCGPDDAAVKRGVEHLIRTQRADGNWDEKEFTGTGFPLVAYLEYPLYRLNMPLLALGMYRTALSSGRRPTAR